MKGSKVLLKGMRYDELEVLFSVLLIFVVVVVVSTSNAVKCFNGGSYCLHLITYWIFGPCKCLSLLFLLLMLLTTITEMGSISWI